MKLSAVLSAGCIYEKKPRSSLLCALFRGWREKSHMRCEVSGNRRLYLINKVIAKSALSEQVDSSSCYQRYQPAERRRPTGRKAVNEPCGWVMITESTDNDTTDDDDDESLTLLSTFFKQSWRNLRTDAIVNVDYLFEDRAESITRNRANEWMSECCFFLILTTKEEKQKWDNRALPIDTIWKNVVLNKTATVNTPRQGMINNIIICMVKYNICLTHERYVYIYRLLSATLRRQHFINDNN